MESQHLLNNKETGVSEVENESSGMIIEDVKEINEIFDNKVKEIVENNDDIVSNKYSVGMIVETTVDRIEAIIANDDILVRNENSDDMIVENVEDKINKIVDNQAETVVANNDNLSAMTLDDSKNIVPLPMEEIKMVGLQEIDESIRPKFPCSHHSQIESENVIPQVSSVNEDCGKKTNGITDNHVETVSVNKLPEIILDDSKNIVSLPTEQLVNTFRPQKINESGKLVTNQPESLITDDSINSLSSETTPLGKIQPINKSTVKTNGNVSNSLGLLVAYESDSDSADEEIKIVREEINIDNPKAKDYRTKNIESSDSSDSEDDSSSSSSGSSNSSSSSEKEDEDEDSDHSTKGKKSNKKEQRHQEKGEYDNLPPIEDLKISVEEVRCDPLGEVSWMVEQMVIVKPKPGKPTLNLDTILFLERGKRPLGRIFDVFGQVSEPHYCVRFNTSEHIKESDVRVGMPVYFVPNSEHTTLVFMYELLKMRAIDEIGEDERPAFSDDEEEAAYEASLKQKKNAQPNPVDRRNSEVPAKRPRPANKPGWKSQHPWSSDKRHQRPNNPRSWQNNQTPAYQSGPPAYQNYSNMVQPSPYQYWSGNQFGHHGHQPRSYFPPQSFQGNVNPPPRSGPSFGWQQQPPPANVQFSPWLPPPPPPPGV